MESPLSSSGELFTPDPYTEIRSLGNDDLIKLIEEVIVNKNIKDGSIMIFQMFHNVMATSIYNKSLDKDYHELNTILKYFNILKEVDKFDAYNFADIFFEEFHILPVEIVWWLHQSKILYFSQYCDVMKPINIAEDIIKIIRDDKKHDIFIVQEIVEDLLLDLIRGYHRPNPGIYRLPRSKIWSDFCFKVLNDLTEETLKAILTEAGNNCLSFVNILKYMNKSKKTLPSIIIRQFYENILNKILAHKVDEYDLYSSYIYQKLWRSGNINKSLLSVYEEIFDKYCKIENVLTIAHDNEDKVNWRLTLSAVGILAKKGSSSSSDIKAVIMRYLEDSFKGGKMNHFMKVFLFARQTYLETNMEDYKSWYSSTFGSSSTYKTTTNPTIFKFIIKSLISLIPYETKLFLKVHINMGLTAPPKCNSLVFDYKDLCRSRLEELKTSPVVLVSGTEVSVLHLVEDSVLHNNIGPVMVNIIQNQYEDFFNIILPQILRNKVPYTKVKQLLLDQQFITNDMIHFCNVDPDDKTYDNDDDDDDMFVVHK